jgi:hypothetical protein
MRWSEYMYVYDTGASEVLTPVDLLLPSIISYYLLICLNPLYIYKMHKMHLSPTVSRLE